MNPYKHRVGAESKQHVFLTGNDMYALRCAVLHEGNLDISTQSARKVHEKFFFTVGHPHLRQINSVLQLNIVSFCHEVIDAVSIWLNEFMLKQDKQHLLEDMVSIFSGEAFSTNDL